MKKRTGIISLILVICMLVGTFPITAQAADYEPDINDYSYSFRKRHEFPGDYTYMADALNKLGLFLGTGNDYALDSKLSRIQALVTIIRLIDKEAEAKAIGTASSFTDVPKWASGYAAYGQKNSIMLGYSENTLGADDTVTANQYATMLLRALGYSDAQGDFAYNSAVEFAYEIGLMDSWAHTYLSGNPVLKRNEAVYMMYQFLYTTPKSGGDPLILQLAFKNAEWKNKTAASLIANGESETEIRRALLNGYHEYNLTELYAIVDSNKNIPADYKPIVKDSFYNWLKEAGVDAAAEQLKSYIGKIKMYVRSQATDEILASNRGILAYFMYPDMIVVRHDLDLGTQASTLAHELRHAMSGSMGLSILEEGMTEFWSQEVDGGHYTYQYYYVNTVKLLAHLVGAETMSTIDFTGNYEDLFYELERAIGNEIDKVALYINLGNMTSDIGLSDNLTALAKQYMGFVREYYSNNLDDIIAASGSEERFVETIIALGQLIYYPSTMVRRAEGCAVSGKPSDYYSGEFTLWVDEILSAYSRKTGASVTSMKSHYNANRDKRFSYEYFGADAGSLFVNEGTAYTVYYRYDSVYNSKVFGDKAEAEAFQKLVKVMNVTETPGEGFVIRTAK